MTCPYVEEAGRCLAGLQSHQSCTDLQFAPSTNFWFNGKSASSAL
jgi:hypothetical protein